jgi:predicted small secreted protein
MRYVRELVLWGLLAAFCISMVGCNTVEGLGRDIEEAGMAIQEACR